MPPDVEQRKSDEGFCNLDRPKTRPATLGAERDGRTSMKIRDVMTPDIEVVTPDDTVRTAAQIMADLDFAVLPVSDNNRLIGMVTGREIAMRVVAEGRDPGNVTVRQAMSSDVLYCFENQPVNDVARKMSDWWVRRLPVVNREKRLIGMVSLADLMPRKSIPKRPETGRPARRSQARRSAGQPRRAPRRAVAA